MKNAHEVNLVVAHVCSITQLQKNTTVRISKNHRFDFGALRKPEKFILRWGNLKKLFLQNVFSDKKLNYKKFYLCGFLKKRCFEKKFFSQLFSRLWKISMALSSGGSKKFKSDALFVGFEKIIKSQLQIIPPMRVSKKAVFRLSKRCQFGLGRLPRSRELVAKTVVWCSKTMNLRESMMMTETLRHWVD